MSKLVYAADGYVFGQRRICRVADHVASAGGRVVCEARVRSRAEEVRRDPCPVMGYRLLHLFTDRLPRTGDPGPRRRALNSECEVALGFCRFPFRRRFGVAATDARVGVAKVHEDQAEGLRG